MASPAQLHRMRVLAAKASAADPAAPVVVGGIQGQMLAKLTQDARRLHDIQSIERKIALKRELLPDYQAYIDGVLEGDGGQPDEIVPTVMLWHLDAGNYERGLDIAAYVLRHDLPLPERLKRNTATILLDEVAGAIAGGAVKEPSAAFGILQRVAVLVNGHDSPDQARAKLHFAMGKTLAQQAGDTPSGPQLDMAHAAVAQLKRAVELFSGIGAKKLIEQLERKIKKAGDPG
ncbi:phage terminase small subunit [Achromobacter denitrificans]|uniref:phage terminase small subunit n=1 Tax=Achromobacter denitrificans TaxID=32002 RepID=UPI000F68E871|nr:phage terminase small subunit [Achromobacter denitrificans]RSE76644.1 integrase [Achromobacter denitrificans]